MILDPPVVYTSGVKRNTIFDQVSSDISGRVPVSAVQFHVNCKNVPGATQSSTMAQNRSLAYTFHVDDNLEDLEVVPGKPVLRIGDEAHFFAKSTAHNEHSER